MKDKKDFSDVISYHSIDDCTHEDDMTHHEVIIRNGWNFHNDIALRLEMKARNLFGDWERPYTKIYDADSIESGSFAEVMIELLRLHSNRENNRVDIDEFVMECAAYIGKTGYEIEPKKAQILLNWFLELLEK